MNLLDIAIAKKMSGGGGSEPTIEALSVTENGTYTAPSGVDGYNPITVNVSGGGGASNVEYGEIECNIYDTNTTELSYSGNGYPTHLIVFEKTGSLIVDSGIFVARLVKKDLATPMTYNGDLAYTTCNYYYGSKWNVYYSDSAYISPQGGSVTNQMNNCIGFTKENGVIKLHLKGKGSATQWGVATGTYVYFVIFSE